MNTVRNAERSGVVADPGDGKPTSPIDQTRSGTLRDSQVGVPSPNREQRQAEIRLTVRDGRVVVTEG